ncbi:MAG TPA: ribosome-associated translation inhibitor RaiA [Candidatus Eisenbacteria bacterium]|jgi:ribosome hibernation promoting factor|nr:ribosome-associated translation inhibitor RaiA [Candidatus Eisenbacteria bacterium]
MKIQMTGRHVTVPATVKRRLAERLEKLTRYLPDLSEAQVKLSAQKYRHTAEILIHVRHEDHVSRGEAGDLESAIDTAADRLEAQVRKLKEKRMKRVAAHKAPDGPLRRSAVRAALEVAPAPKPARGNGREDGVSLGRVRVVRDRQADAKPISLAQAAAQLAESEAGFIVFVDAESGRPCVLYRREDGQLALVEARA